MTGLLPLEDWLTTVETDDRPGLHCFAHGIRRDQKGVTAGLALLAAAALSKARTARSSTSNGSYTGARPSTCYLLMAPAEPTGTTERDRSP